MKKAIQHVIAAPDVRRALGDLILGTVEVLLTFIDDDDKQENTEES